eukprot:1910712-Amphidinium_carterae.1
MKNRKANQTGFSPTQRVLGVLPELPEEIFGGMTVEVLDSGPVQAMGRAADIRQAAAVACAKVDGRDKILRAQRANQ